MEEGKSVKSYDLSVGYSKSSVSESEVSAVRSTDDLVARGNWDKPIEFILTCLNYAVGLGNVWRFPHLAFRNGGGAFLIPYLLMVFIIGLPIFFAELFVGQYSGLGPIKAYGFIAPLFKGECVASLSASLIKSNQSDRKSHRKLINSCFCFQPTSGLGYCTLLVITFVSIYYMVIIAWVLFYLWTSFFPSLAWGSCDNDWNSKSASKSLLLS